MTIFIINQSLCVNYRLGSAYSCWQLNRLFALCDPVTVNFWTNINCLARYCDGLSLCKVWWF